MIPAEVKLALYTISLFCRDRDCRNCPLSAFCNNSFDINPVEWEKMLSEEKYK